MGMLLDLDLFSVSGRIPAGLGRIPAVVSFCCVVLSLDLELISI